MSHLSAQEYVAALRSNANRYGRGDLTHAKFSAGNKAIWVQVDKAGRAMHEAVLELLRQGNAAGRKAAPAPMTSGELATLLKERLRPYAKHATISARSSYTEGMLPGIHGSVMVTFAAVPPGSPEIDALNARESFMLTLEAPAWDQGATRRRVHEGGALDVAVDKVKLTQFRGQSKVRGVTGSPEKIADVVVGAVVSAMARAQMGAG